MREAACQITGFAVNLIVIDIIGGNRKGPSNRMAMIGSFAPEVVFKTILSPSTFMASICCTAEISEVLKDFTMFPAGSTI
jgi:hypothetical protein